MLAPQSTAMTTLTCVISELASLNYITFFYVYKQDKLIYETATPTAGLCAYIHVRVCPLFQRLKQLAAFRNLVSIFKQRKPPKPRTI